MKKRLVSLCLLATLTVGRSFAATQDTERQMATDYLATHLRCPLDQFQTGDITTPFLRYLIKTGYIDVSKRNQFDSTSCWILKRPFYADELPIHAVCAASDEAFVVEQNPDLYETGPGTQYYAFALFTSASVDDVNSWLKRWHIAENSNGQPVVAGPKDSWRSAFYPQGGTMVACIN